MWRPKFIYIKLLQALTGFLITSGVQEQYWYAEYIAVKNQNTVR